MKIFLKELNENDKDFLFTQEEGWIREALDQVDEKEGEMPLRPAKPRPATFQLTARKVDGVVVLSGKIDTSVQLLCSRCAVPYKMECHPQFTALYSKDPDLAGVAHLEGNGTPKGQNQGLARSSARSAYEANPSESVLANQDIDITYLSDDSIDLQDVLVEQLQLQVPFQPLCKDDCKGICPQCGADQNKGRCACEKLAKENPFAVLKNFHVENRK